MDNLTVFYFFEPNSSFAASYCLHLNNFILSARQDKVSKQDRYGVEHSSAGRAHTPYVEAIALVAGDPGLNPKPSGLILCVIPPLFASCFLSISTVLYIKGKKSPKKYT